MKDSMNSELQNNMENSIFNEMLYPLEITSVLDF